MIPSEKKSNNLSTLSFTFTMAATLLFIGANITGALPLLAAGALAALLAGVALVASFAV